MRLVDARLRPTVSIDATSIESYYNQELLPQLRQAGAKEVSLADVTPQDPGTPHPAKSERTAGFVAAKSARRK